MCVVDTITKLKYYPGYNKNEWACIWNIIKYIVRCTKYEQKKIVMFDMCNVKLSNMGVIHMVIDLLSCLSASFENEFSFDHIIGD